ncbi:hypothetical protein [Pseudodesulfovibrio pelocollis]|uniref:hypothetical protein n=1 Tax=Pseudodesulfovibrio pelocollis TaxID=3051432 RepID=UPI00255A8FE1|nr:hypothetical protein [Pseudodesulfovibrio sp. SB368]
MTMQILLIACAVISVLVLGMVLMVLAAAWTNLRSWRQVRDAARRRRLEFHPRFRG